MLVACEERKKIVASVDKHIRTDWDNEERGQTCRKVEWEGNAKEGISR